MSSDFVPAVPGSRSIAARALICASLVHGKSQLTNIPDCDDTVAITNCINRLGSKMEVSGSTGNVSGLGSVAPTSEILDCYASGTTMRFISALSLLTNQDLVLTGTPRLLERPMSGLHEVLTATGKTISSHGDQRTISGTPNIPDQLSVDASNSGQFVSGLLMALAACGKPTVLRALNPVSIPFIAMTISVMKNFGAHVEVNSDGTDLLISIQGDGYRPTNFAIEPDIMSANYFLSAAVLTGKSVFIPNIQRDTVQGDVALVDVLARMGATIEFTDGGVRCSRSSESELMGTNIDLGVMPDMCLTFAALATVASGPTSMTSARILQFKESDRLGVILKETTKLGARVEITDNKDTVTIIPPIHITPAAIDTYDDHRVAMAYGLLTLIEPGIVINNPECVSKTWPNYFAELERFRRV